MVPRIIALFEAFKFGCGEGFPTPDPMHFEYTGWSTGNGRAHGLTLSRGSCRSRIDPMH
jgi:hypothetical protein